MKLDVYINYAGTCEQAFRFYEQHLGGKITILVDEGRAHYPLSPSDPASVLELLLTLVHH